MIFEHIGGIRRDQLRQHLNLYHKTYTVNLDILVSSSCFATKIEEHKFHSQKEFIEKATYIHFKSIISTTP